MKDELISKETAILAESKGFNEKCDYHIGVETGRENMLRNTSNSEWKEQRIRASIDYLVTRPTQSLLQRWLREKHKIFTYVRVNISGMMDNPKILWQNNFTIREGKFHETYEESLEDVLKRALETIKI